jgi:NDP-mannose synthase
MQAIILAGGRGTRLRPYTISFPKPLVPVGDQPILEIVIRQLRAHGFDKVTMLTGHLAELIQAYFGDGSRWNLEIEYVRELKPLNTAGALKLVPHCEEDFLVVNGDVLTTLDFRELLLDHRARRADATIASITREHMVDFGVLETDDQSYLTGYNEKPTLRYNVSMGVYALNRSCRELISDGESLGMPDLMLRVLGRGGRVHCPRPTCYWLDIGRPDDYEAAQREIQANPQRFLPDGV